MLLDKIEFGMENGMWLMIGISIAVFIVTVAISNIISYFKNRSANAEVKAQERAFRIQQARKKAQQQAQMSFINLCISDDIERMSVEPNKDLVTLYQE